MLVICNGMNRAGSTYQYNLTRCAVLAAASGHAHGYLDPEEKQGSQSVADDRFREWAAAPEQIVVKSHDVHPLLPELIGTGTIRVLYIYRDIRDVAVSLKRMRPVRGLELFQLLDSFVERYRALARLRAEWPRYVLWQQYETVMADPPKALGEILSFLGLELHAEAIDEILTSCSIDAARSRCEVMRKALEENVAALRRQNPRAAARFLWAIGRGVGDAAFSLHDGETLLRYNHISRDRGASGVWHDLLPRDERRVLTARYAEWLREAGYDLEPVGV